MRIFHFREAIFAVLASGVAMAWLLAGAFISHQRLELAELGAVRRSFESNVGHANSWRPKCCGENSSPASSVVASLVPVLELDAILERGFGAVAGHNLVSTATSLSSGRDDYDLVHMELRGSFFSLKSYLNDQLMRHPLLGVQSIQLTRGEGEVSGSVDFRLYRAAIP